jgi:hypothetical protein
MPDKAALTFKRQSLRRVHQSEQKYSAQDAVT